MFQSTLPCKERPRFIRLIASITSFNPRSRARSDHKEVVNLLIKVGFNPRSRARSDFVDDFQVFIISVSIHAPVQGATI